MIAVQPVSDAPISRRGDPVWEVAFLFPEQGEWTEEEYLGLRTGRMIELSDGCLEVLPVATLFHQFIVQYLFRLLDDFVRARKLGAVATAPVPVRLAPGKMREPNVFFLRPGRIRSARRPPEGADLVMEVLSDGDDNRDRDLVTKRGEYAAAGVAEVWIVDPLAKAITVLSLPDGATEYEVHGAFPVGGIARSRLLAEFSVDVDAAFAAAIDEFSDEMPA